jgi:hypothetical protein
MVKPHRVLFTTMAQKVKKEVPAPPSSQRESKALNSMKVLLKGQSHKMTGLSPSFIFQQLKHPWKSAPGVKLGH